MSRSLRLTVRLALVALAAAIIVSGVGCAPRTGQQKIKIESLDDLPRHAYQLDGSVSGLLKSDEQFAAFAKQVRSDVESDLATYEIDDAATLQGFYGTLLSLDMLEGRYDDALKRVAQIRALEDKEAARLMTGLSTKAMVAAARDTGAGVDDPKYRAVFRRHLAASVKDLPWDVVQDDIKQAKGMAEVFSENLLMGLVQAQIDPVVAQAGEISSDLAERVVRLRYGLVLRLPLKDELISVYQEKIDAHQVVKKDVWPARSVALDQSRNLQPVVVAIWDSGVDASVFTDRLFTNPDEQPDGTDTDGNGFVDDVHGIAYDVNGVASPELLHPFGDMAGRVDAAMEHMKGFMDVQAAIDSPEAAALKKHLSGLSPDEIEGFIEGLGFCGQWAHGTHVAGIAVDGNPFAKILVARVTFDYHTIPQAVTVEIAKRHAKSYHAAVDYFKQHGVRVANMSWGWTLKEIESSLEANNVGGNAEERAELASKVLSILSKGLHDAIESAPEILFVSSAGNEDSDVEFDQVIPSSFELPNLLIVGAVDQAGEPTSFTSTGRNVVVYANGFEVESYVPGGERMKMSGTSMSSPNVMNLAAKLIALDPELTPAEVIDLIKRGADRKEGALSYLLLNPKRSVELLEAK
jgi:subtilisin family serine protease